MTRRAHAEHVYRSNVASAMWYERGTRKLTTRALFLKVITTKCSSVHGTCTMWIQ